MIVLIFMLNNMRRRSTYNNNAHYYHNSLTHVILSYNCQYSNCWTSYYFVILSTDFMLMDCALTIALFITKVLITVRNESKLIELVMRIELSRAIVLPRLSNLLKNSTVHFRTILYLVACFLRVISTTHVPI